MDIRQMEYMLALAARKNLSAAAAACFISQSALSQSLTRLEQFVGVRLFERRSHSWIPTEAGRHYLDAAGKIVDIHNRLLLDLGVTGKGEGHLFRLGMTLERSSKVFPQVEQRFRKEFPETGLHLVEEHAYKLQRMVMQGELDMAVCVVPAAHQEEELRELSLADSVTEELVLITAPAHPFALRCRANPGRYPSAAELSGENIIRHGKQKALRHLLDALFEQRGIRPREHFDVSSTTAVVEFVGKGSGISFVPKLFAQNNESVCIIPMENPLTWDLGVIFRKGRSLSPVERRLSAIIREELMKLLHGAPVPAAAS